MNRALMTGAGWMLVTTFFFVCVHATGKHLVATYPLAQVVWARYVFHLLIAALILGQHLPRIMRTTNLRLQLLRSGFMLGATTLYFGAVQFLPLTEANAINFTTPILVVLLAQPLLGERVGWRRWLGALGGVAGAMVIIRPGSGLMDLAALIVVGSSLCNACYQVTTRKLGAREDPLTTLFYTALVGALATSVALPLVWTPVDATGWALMVALGGFAVAGHFALIKAFRAAPAAVIAPFNTTTLLWSVLFGLLVFGDLPDRWTMLGALILVASGLYILRAGGRA